MRISMGMSTDVLPLPDVAALPDDPALLKQLVVQLLDELQRERGARERLEHHLHLLLKKVYGSTSEKFDPQQGVLFDPGQGQDEAAASVPPPAASATPKHRHRHGRGRIPDETKREEAVHDLTAARRTGSSCRRKLASNSTGDPRPCSLPCMSARNTPARNCCPRAA
jgi:transposase